MGDIVGSRVGSRAPSAAKQTAAQLKALTQYGPDYLRTTQNLSEELTPRQNALDYSQYQQYSPLFSQLGAEEQQRGIQHDMSALNNGGQALADRAVSMERSANPEWTKSMQDTNAGYQSLIGGMDPNKLSGAEMANTERGINRMNTRTGNLNTGDSTTTAANAMTFGGALDQKRQNFGQALNLFPGISQASKSNVDAFAVGTGKASGANTGLQQYRNNATGSQQQIGQLGSNIAGSQQAQMGLDFNRKTVDQSAHDAMGSCMGCYIFKEVYGFPDAPMYVRWCRDFYYQQDRSVAKGYRKMSYWLVPLMQKSRLVRTMATGAIILPLAGYGQYLCGYKKWTKVFKPIVKFWLKVWSISGK